MSDADTCVAYLVRFEEGTSPVGRFLDAYAAHDSGAPHRLVVLRRGFASHEAWGKYADLFEERGVLYDTLDVGAAGFDIGAYRDALEMWPAEAYCFLNTFSEVLCDGWLAQLHRAVHLDRVGLVGATGSYESLFSASAPSRRHARAPGGAAIRSWLRARGLRREFAPFPNPHIRTNAFMLRRTIALALVWGPFRTKEDLHRAESGRSGLSSQALAAGLRNLVVDREGRLYEPDEWPESETFRFRDQSNLMVADNRTREYSAASSDGRESLGRLAWGERYRSSEQPAGACADPSR